MNYKELVENSQDLIWRVDTQGVFTYVNKSIETVLGYKEEEVLGESSFSFLCEEDKIKIQELFNQLLETKEHVSNLENTMKHKDGHFITFETTASPIMDDDNNLIGYQGIDRNITQQKELQQELETLNKQLKENVEEKNIELKNTINRYEFAIKASNDGLWDWNIITGEIYYSKRWKEMLGYEEHELGNSLETWNSLIHPNDFDLCMKSIHKSLSGEIDYFENRHRLRHKNGSWVWVFDKGKTFFNKKGTAIRMAGFHTDITKQVKNENLIKEKESLLIQQSKMSETGSMINNIAHQWRQPLSTIMSTASGIKIKKELGFLPDEELISFMNDIEHSTEYLSQTIDDFRNFFNPNKIKSSYSLSSIIQSTINISSAQFKDYDIKIEVQIEDVKLTLIKNELVQALINLLNNSKDALVENELDEKLIFLSTKKVEDHVHIVLKDNAKGIPDNIINNVFDPYFTTKEKKGTGIGLYMTKEIIEKHFNGKLYVQNQSFNYNGTEQKGAEFIIELPLDN